MMLKEYKEKKIQDAEFAKAYEEIQPEMDMIRTAVETETSQDPKQKQRILSELRSERETTLS